MNRQIQEVESTLSTIGRNCNADIIDKKSHQVNKLERDTTEPGQGTDRSLVAQLTLLHRCTSTISRLLRRHESLLLTSKLLVISRLLHKTLSEREDAPPFVDSLRSQLVSLRKTTLRRIDRKLGSPTLTGPEIIDCLSAYCLISNMSSMDVIRHFHQVRQAQILRQLKQGSSASKVIPKALNLYIRTLQNSKALFSRRFLDALGSLQSRPLLHDGDIRGVSELDIDVFERWVASSVRHFTPWIKLNEVSKAEAEKIIKSWSRQAFGQFVDACRAPLENQAGVAELISLRKRTVDMWLAEASATPTHSSLSVLEGLRDVFNTQLIRILQQQAKQLELIGAEVSSVIEQWDDRDDGSVKSLWDRSLPSMDYSDGAAEFKQSVMDTLLGQDAKLANVLQLYRSWRSTIERSQTLVEQLRHTKWDDDFASDEDEDDTNMIGLLVEDDPRLLTETIKAAIKQAFEELQSSLESSLQSFGSANERGKAAFFLRLIRDLRRDLPSNVLQGDEDFSFADRLIPSLHETLVRTTLSQASPETMLKGPTSTTAPVPGRTLWAGDPLLPTQPLPSTFQFLLRLSEAMESCGPDLWNHSATRVLKQTLNKRVAECLVSALDKLEGPRSQALDSNASNDAASGISKDDQTARNPGESADATHARDWRIQLLFDAFYFRNAFSLPSADDDQQTDSLGGFVEKLQGDVETGDGIIGSIQEAAHAYWTRTELLFGLVGY